MLKQSLMIAIVSLTISHQNKFLLLALNTRIPSVRLKKVASKIKLTGSDGTFKDWIGDSISSKYLRNVGTDLLYCFCNSFSVCLPKTYF